MRFFHLFAEYALNSRLTKALETLKFDTPTEVQAETIPQALKGDDLLVSAETGSGKTAAFLIPIIHKLLEKSVRNTGTRALILVPTRELARQVLVHCQHLTAFCRINSGLIMGGDTFKEQKAMLRKNPEIIIATPGRLLEHVQRATTDFDDLEFLVLDEADRMLDMGLSEEVLDIATQCNLTGTHRQTLLFSATLKHAGAAEIASKILSNPEKISIGQIRSKHDKITQQIIMAEDHTFKKRLLKRLLASEPYKKAMVFTNTRQQTQALRKSLSTSLHHEKLPKVEMLHGEMAQDDRNLVLSGFRQGRFQILIATDVAARGLDIKDVDLIINFDMAQSGDEYIHRIGRTGRAGKEGLAISLIEPKEWNLMSKIENYLKTQFERRVLKGLTSRYQGPKPPKASTNSSNKMSKEKSASKSNHQKKSQSPQEKSKFLTSRDGFGPLRKKK